MFPYEVKFEYGVTKKAVRRALLKEAHDPKEGGWQHMCEVAVTEFDIWIGSLSPESHEDFWKRVGLEYSDVLYGGHCRLYDRNEGDRLGIQFRGGRSLDGDVSDEERRARMFEIIKQVGEALDLPFEKDVTVLEDGKFKRHKEL
jgi:hypothetical protein